MQQTKVASVTLLAVISAVAVPSAVAEPLGVYTSSQEVERSAHNTHRIGIISGLDTDLMVNFTEESPEDVRVDRPEDRVLEPQELEKSYYTGDRYVKAAEFRFDSYSDGDISRGTSFDLQVDITAVEPGEGVEGNLQFSREVTYTLRGEDTVNRGFESGNGDEKNAFPDVVVGEESDETEEQDVNGQNDEKPANRTSVDGDGSGSKDSYGTYFLMLIAALSVLYLFKVIT